MQATFLSVLGRIGLRAASDKRPYLGDSGEFRFIPKLMEQTRHSSKRSIALRVCKGLRPCDCPRIHSQHASASGL